MLHKTYDSWKTTDPADEFLGPEPEDELPPEPTVEEVWDGSGEYVHVVTFASGEKFTIARQLGGAFSGDYSIHGRDFYSDGFLDPETAIERLFDMARNQ